MNRLMLVAPVIAAMLAANVFADDQAGWISMFNGKDLAGWKANEKPGSFKVEDGAIVELQDECEGDSRRDGETDPQRDLRRTGPEPPTAQSGGNDQRVGTQDGADFRYAGVRGPYYQRVHHDQLSHQLSQ